MELEKLFCDVDDFCKEFEKTWQQELLSGSGRKRQKKCNLCYYSEFLIQNSP